MFPMFCKQKNVSYFEPLCIVVPQFNVDVATSANAVAANAEQMGFVPVPRTVTADWAEIVNSLKATGPTIVPTFATVTRSIALAETIVITATAAMSGINRYRLDRKSTRLNSSHGSISYAVFCLKKKK